jgi:hypothetical protein
MAKCKTCKGEGWVCENHPNKGWGYGEACSCGGAGAPCACNTIDPPWHFQENTKQEGSSDA